MLRLCILRLPVGFTLQRSVGDVASRQASNEGSAPDRSACTDIPEHCLARGLSCHHAPVQRRSLLDRGWSSRAEHYRDADSVPKARQHEPSSDARQRQTRRWGVSSIPASTASFVAALSIVFVPMFLLLMKKKPTRNNMVGIAFILAGLVNSGVYRRSLDIRVIYMVVPACLWPFM